MHVTDPLSLECIRLLTDITEKWEYSSVLTAGAAQSVQWLGYQKHILFFSLWHADQLSGELSPISNTYLQQLSPGGKAVSVKFTTHLHLVPKQKIRGVTTPFPTYL